MRFSKDHIAISVIAILGILAFWMGTLIGKSSVSALIDNFEARIGVEETQRLIMTAIFSFGIAVIFIASSFANWRKTSE